jgi:hypothetical protein
MAGVSFQLFRISASSAERIGRGNDKRSLDIPVMHLLGISALVIGIAALLILVFLNVVKQLLSRNFVDAPSWSDAEHTQAIADAADGLEGHRGRA